MFLFSPVESDLVCLASLVEANIYFNTNPFLVWIFSISVVLCCCLETSITLDRVSTNWYQSLVRVWTQIGRRLIFCVSLGVDLGFRRLSFSGFRISLDLEAEKLGFLSYDLCRSKVLDPYLIVTGCVSVGSEF